MPATLSRRALLWVGGAVASTTIACSASTPAGTTPPAQKGTPMPDPGEIATREPGQHLAPHDTLRMAPDGHTISALGFGEGVTWQTSTGRIARRVRLDGRPPAVKWDWAPGVIVTAGHGDATAELRDAESGGITRVLRAGGPARSLSLSPDAALLAVTTGSSCSVWNVADGARLTEFELGPATDGGPTVGYAPDGRLVVCQSKDAALQFRSPEGLTVDSEVTAVETPFHHLTFAAQAPVATVIRVGTDRQFTVQVLNTDDWSVIAEHPVPEAAQHTALHPRGTHLAYAGSEKSHDDAALVRIVDLANGGVTVGRGGKGRVQSLSFAPDGAEVFSLSAEQGVVAWRVPDASLTRVFDLPD